MLANLETNTVGDVAERRLGSWPSPVTPRGGLPQGFGDCYGEGERPNLAHATDRAARRTHQPHNLDI